MGAQDLDDANAAKGGAGSGSGRTPGTGSTPGRAGSGGKIN
jgi:hypothetical protein